MSDRKVHWEEVYQSKDMVSVSWFQQAPVISLSMIDRVRSSLDHPVIDIGGGTSPLTSHLLERGYTNLSVLDISGKALELARAALGDTAARVQWIEADATEFKAAQRFAVWHDRAVFHFLTDAADRDAYVAVLRASMLPGGHIILATFALDGPRRCSGLDTAQYDADLLCSVLGKEFRLVEETVEMHRTPSGAEQKFAWFLLQFNPEGDVK